MKECTLRYDTPALTISQRSVFCHMLGVTALQLIEFGFPAFLTLLVFSTSEQMMGLLAGGSAVNRLVDSWMDLH